MKLSFEYKGIKVTYYLTYKKAKAISINITGDGVVNVTAPRGTSVFSVMDKVKGNAPWIIKELIAKQKIKVEVPQRLPEQYTYLGKNYKLELNITKEIEEPKVKMSRGKFVVETPSDSPAVVRPAIVEWYKQKVTAKVKERIKEYSSQFKVLPETIEVIDDKTTLFEANSERFVVNVRMGMLSVDIMDFIIVSSLCRNNNEDSESEMKQLQKILPEYAASKTWLEAHKNELVI